MKSIKKRTVGGLIGIIAEEDICVGFVLAGCGETDINDDTNIYVVENETPASDIKKWLEHLIHRRDILIVAISKAAAEKVRSFISQVEEAVPQIIEIPNKYDEDYQVETQLFQRRLEQVDFTGTDTSVADDAAVALKATTSCLSADAASTGSTSLDYNRATAPYISTTALQNLEEARRNQSGIFAPIDEEKSEQRKVSRSSIQSFLINRVRRLKFDDEMSGNDTSMSLTQSSHSTYSRKEDKRLKEAERKRQEEERKKNKEKRMDNEKK